MNEDDFKLKPKKKRDSLQEQKNEYISDVKKHYSDYAKKVFEDNAKYSAQVGYDIHSTYAYKNQKKVNQSNGRPAL